MTKTSSPARPADESHLRPAGRATRAAIEEAARRLFAERGFDASVRAIATEAGVDPALVIRHFGSKEALFLRCVDTAGGIGAVLDGPLETVGRRPGRLLPRPRPPAAAPAVPRPGPGCPPRPGARGDGPAHRRDLRRPARPPAERRAPRVCGSRSPSPRLGGLLNLVFRREDPIVTGAATEDLVALYGDAIQRILTP
ncbi:TetR family transcriptional regulator [Nocardioides convexus]|uniref:TetR family transcriptional regulator n=1 Tax=Nocardioides convexus TaxID=2712224 RepID=UPI002418AADC|nr:TetR family transcriptional regulator [Nocardioides convexus]